MKIHKNPLNHRHTSSRVWSKWHYINLYTLALRTRWIFLSLTSDFVYHSISIQNRRKHCFLRYVYVQTFSSLLPTPKLSPPQLYKELYNTIYLSKDLTTIIPFYCFCLCHWTKKKVDLIFFLWLRKNEGGTIVHLNRKDLPQLFTSKAMQNCLVVPYIKLQIWFCVRMCWSECICSDTDFLLCKLHCKYWRWIQNVIVAKKADYFCCAWRTEEIQSLTQHYRF